jgi:hypothetical protein
MLKSLVFTSTCCISLAFLSVCSAPARAADPAPAEAVSPARALFKEGRELVSQGDFKAACPKFEQSLALESGLGTQFNLADCWEHIGRTASAQALFVGAAASAKAAGQTEREQVLRDRAAALEPRIPRLVIEVSDQDPKLIVKRGDLPLESDAYGKAKSVDPGSYEITAKAPGKKTWTKKVEVAAGAGIVTVEVPKLEAEAAPPPEEAKKPEEKPKPAPAPVDPPNPSAHHGRTGAAMAFAIAGGVGLGFAAVMAAKYSSANSDAKAICPSNHGCTSSEILDHDQKVEDARSARNLAYGGLGVGLTGVGVAALLFLRHADSESPTHSAWSATPVVTANGTLGASLSGKF